MGREPLIAENGKIDDGVCEVAVHGRAESIQASALKETKNRRLRGTGPAVKCLARRRWGPELAKDHPRPPMVALEWCGSFTWVELARPAVVWGLAGLFVLVTPQG